jgi:aminocarboxymuconate-semialdehyde decarboxylase
VRYDLHTHFLPNGWEDWGAKYTGNRWPRFERCDACSADIMVGERLFRHVTDQCWDAEKRIADMERLGIDVQVISPVPVMLCYWAEANAAQAFARMQNGYCADIVSRHPDRFKGMATVPLQDTGLAIAELRHAVETLGLKAVEIGTFPGGRDLDHPDVFPFFEACADLDVSVFVHPAGQVVGQERMGDYYLPNIVGNPLETAMSISRFILGGVAERLPNLRVLWSHGGGAFAFVLGRLTHGWNIRDEARAHATKAPIEYAKTFWYDTITHSPDALHYVLDALGNDRMVIGTDFPFGMGEKDPVGFLDRCNLDPSVRKMIEHANAERFLGIA